MLEDGCWASLVGESGIPGDIFAVFDMVSARAMLVVVGVVNFVEVIGYVNGRGGAPYTALKDQIGCRISGLGLMGRRVGGGDLAKAMGRQCTSDSTKARLVQHGEDVGEVGGTQRGNQPMVCDGYTNCLHCLLRSQGHTELRSPSLLGRNSPEPNRSSVCAI
jgi:hypothetical protein